VNRAAWWGCRPAAWEGGMFVCVEDSAQTLLLSDVQAGDLFRISDRRWSRTQWPFPAVAVLVRSAGALVGVAHVRRAPTLVTSLLLFALGLRMLLTG